jgi:hypothetical protein
MLWHPRTRGAYLGRHWTVVYQNQLRRPICIDAAGLLGLGQLSWFDCLCAKVFSDAVTVTLLLTLGDSWPADLVLHGS